MSQWGNLRHFGDYILVPLIDTKPFLPAADGDVTKDVLVVGGPNSTPPTAALAFVGRTYGEWLRVAEIP